MTGLDAAAQWLAGGGGSVLRFFLYVFVAWLLVGALPRMRRDAAEKVPQVRGLARDRMRHHAKAARVSGRGKPAEWWGWAGVAAGAESAKFGRYVLVSAWHGWGDHRRRLRALRESRPWRNRTAPSQDGGGPSQPPPGGGGGGTGPPQPDRPRQPSQPDRPRQPSQPDRPRQPPQPDRPSRDRTTPEPSQDEPGGGKVIVPRPGFFPASQESGKEGTSMADSEISNLEAALQVVSHMQTESKQALDAALAEKTAAEKALADVEQASNDLAAAGVTGPVMEAFVRYHEAMEQAEIAARAKAAACEAALAAADQAAGALRRHQDAADHLRATGGAASTTRWYGAAG